MKIKKLLSILLTMNSGENDQAEIGLPSKWIPEKVDRIYGSIQEFEEIIKNRVGDFKSTRPQLPTGKVKIRVHVADPKGKGTSSVVKFYPVIDTFSPVNHRIDYHHCYSDSRGFLEVDLPRYTFRGFNLGKGEAAAVRAYRIEVSKGSEYFIETAMAELDKEGVIDCRFTLRSFIDLRSRGWFAGDLHHHSVYSSPLHGGTDDVSETPGQVMNAMTANGLTFGALSDHHNIYNHSEWLATETDDFLPIVSKEISTSNGHVLSLNVPEDIIYRIPEKKDRTFEYLLSEFERITGRIRDLGGLAQINHPRDMQEAISLSEEMTGHIDLFETIEIWNGSIPMIKGTTNDSAAELWFSLLREDRFIAATTGSDTHNTAADDYNDMLDEMYWFSHLIRGMDRNGLNGDLKEKYGKVLYFLDLFEKEEEKLERWAKTSLGTACVRTYVHCSGAVKLTGDAVLESLRKGRSILTNGPLLLPEINGCSCGDTVKIGKDAELILSGMLCSNRRLKTLEIISKRGILSRVGISDIEEGELRNISVPLDKGKLKDRDWIVCRAFSDHTNLVMTNPVFIEFH